MTDPLAVIRHLSELHRTAVLTMYRKDDATTPSAHVYEEMALEIAAVMISVAQGVDPDGALIDIQDQFNRLADDAGARDAAILRAWARRVAVEIGGE